MLVIIKIHENSENSINKDFLFSASTGRNLAAPQSGELHTEFDVERQSTERQARAMYFTKTPPISTTRPTPSVNETERNVKESAKYTINSTNTNETLVNTTEVQPIQWTPVNTTDTNVSIIALPENTTLTNITSDYTNVSDSQNSTFASRRRNLTKPEFIKEDLTLEGVAESRIVTEKPLSLETTYLQTIIPPNVESSRRVIDSGDGGMDTGVIAGISFAALVLVALAGSTTFVLYRRRYLNKPQTLNDKCSNPDSSGYLDDSTIRVSSNLVCMLSPVNLSDK